MHLVRQWRWNVPHSSHWSVSSHPLMVFNVVFSIYVGTKTHSFNIFFFNFNSTRSDSICVMSKMCGLFFLLPFSLLLFEISLERNKVLLIHTLFYEPLPPLNAKYFSVIFFRFYFSVQWVHYQLEKKRWWMHNNVIKVSQSFVLIV